MRSTTFHSFVTELVKLSAVSNLGQDFLGGVDPFGNWTAQYGQAAEQARVNETEHRKKQLVTGMGGVVGGAAVVPSAVYGLISAGQGAAAGRGVGGKLLGALRGGARGSAEPLRGLYHAGKSVKFLNRSAATGKIRAPSAAERKSLEFVADRIPLAALGSRKLHGLSVDKVRAAAGSARLSAIPSEQAALQQMTVPAQAALNKARAQLGLGGVVGSGGALVQYNKGRAVEKEFRNR